MKKLLAFLLAAIMLFSLTACGEKEDDTDDVSLINETVSSIEDDTDDVSSINEIVSSVNEESYSDSDSEWRKFIADYEAVVDEYIEIAKRYKENPSDLSLLSDCYKVLSEISELSERADKIAVGLVDTDAALEYTAELLRISAKLDEVEY